MRIKDYNQMMSHLTRPGTPEQNKKMFILLKCIS